MKFKQGLYTPKNPDKYVGDLNKIIYRSSWELRFFAFLDSNPNVLHWSSENIVVPYIKPTDQKIHRYFPDLFVEYQNKNGEIKREIIEIKPKQQTKQSRTKNPKTKLYEDLTFAINVAKWKACQEYCKARGLEFKIVTEQTLFR